MNLPIDQALTRAIEAHKSGLLQDAERLYKEILQEQPRHPDANHNLGVLAVEAGNPDAALPYLKAALEANPKQGQFWVSYINALVEARQLSLAAAVLAQGKGLGLTGDAVTQMEQKLGEPVPESPSQEEINELLSQFNAGNLPTAEQLARALTKIFPDHPFGWKALGAIYMKAGRLHESLEPMHRAVHIGPDDAEAHNNLGNVLRGLRQLAESEACYREAIRLKPNLSEAHSNLGNALWDLGRLAEAEACYRKAICLKPDYAEAHSNLGNVLKDHGQMTEAEASYREALRLKPDHVEAHNNLGNILNGLGRLTEAEGSFREALRLKSDYAEAHSNLGNVLKAQGRLTEAEACYREALRLKSDYAEAHNNLGNALRDQGRLTEAEGSLREVLLLKPDLAEGHNNLGNVLKDRGRLTEAEVCYREALRLKPGYSEAHNNLGNVLWDQGRLTGAEACYLEALRLKPDLAEAHSNLGNVLKDQGRLMEAEACYREALRLKPDYAEAHSNILFGLNYVESLPNEVVLEEAKRYGFFVSAQAQPKFTSWCEHSDLTRLRVGFVSGDLRNHPVGYFIEGMLKHLVRSQFDLVAFPTTPKSDDLTDRIKPLFQAWKPIVGKSDLEAAAEIHRAGIDILFDLSGHTAHNRLPVFAYKPAPVQVTWLGYFASTGLPEMDYILANPHVIPPGEEGHFTEKVWRLPETSLCFTPPDIEVDVSSLPALANGFITFGCFNSLTKMNERVVSLWAEILKRVPGSKLFLKARQFADAKAIEDVLSRYESHGVYRERLILEGPSKREEYLSDYNRVDMALDPFPFPGGTTSVEGLWMGVPVLTLKGDRFISHQGEAIVSNAGLSDWIAQDLDDYMAMAVRFASDVPALASLRGNLREKVLGSPLCDASRFARYFEEAIRGMCGTAPISIGHGAYE